MHRKEPQATLTDNLQTFRKPIEPNRVLPWGFPEAILGLAWNGCMQYWVLVTQGTAIEF